LNLLTEVLVGLALFIGVLSQAAIGFGSAVIAMPIVAMLVGMGTASPLIGLVLVVANVAIVGSDYLQIDWRATWRILLSSVLGMPLGLLLILYAPGDLVKGILGAILVGYGIYSFLPRVLPPVINEKWAYLFGFIAGILGSAYNVNGPPVVIYSTLRRWPPERFRATLSGFFLPSGVMIIMGHFLSGLWTRQVWHLFLITLPGVLAALWIGGRLNKRIDQAKFDRFTYGLVILMGVLLFIPS
jgi:uncharacterized membrane protein YfcA